MSKKDIPFEFEIPVNFFEKADAEPGRQRRIGGIVTTEDEDAEGETILQRGLDFGHFLKNGWFNDNHSKDTTGILGYPEMTQRFQKGDLLPDGEIATSNGTWSEGYLLSTPKADEIWELGRALQGTGRHLGFSVEGKIQRRTGPRNKVIAKAKVRNVAITNCPVNDRSRLAILAKSLRAVEDAEMDEAEKALGMGTSDGPLTQPAGSQTGETAGQVLARESLESDKKVDEREDEDEQEQEVEQEEEVGKSLSDAEAVAWLQEQRPSLSAADAGRIVDITKRLKARGRL